MDLQGYLRVLRKRWLSIAIMAVLGLAVAFAYNRLATPTYQAASQLFVSVSGGQSNSDLLQGSNFTQQRVKSYVDLASSPIVLQPVVDELELDVTAEQLSRQVSAASPLDTVLIEIAVTDTSPERAAAIANATAQSLATAVGELETPSDGKVSPVKVSVVSEATAPTIPYSPRTRVNLALGLIIGLALGVALAVLRETLDTRVHGVDDVEAVTDSSVIGVIGYDSQANDHHLVVRAQPQSEQAEAFRRLRTNLQFLDLTGDSQVITITSAVPGEGKSTTTVNLALALADSGAHVLVVDADLRRPTVAEYMGIEGSVGLTTVLIGQASLEDVVQPWGGENLHVLPSGQVPPNPSELLGSEPMGALLQKLAAEYDVVLLDTAPLLPVTDAAVLAKQTSGAVVVVGAEQVDRKQLGDALESLHTIGANVLGIVVNRVSKKSAGSYSYYGTYGPEAPPKKKEAEAPRGRREKR